MATYGLDKNEFNSYVGSVLLSVENKYPLIGKCFCCFLKNHHPASSCGVESLMDGKHSIASIAANVWIATGQDGLAISGFQLENTDTSRIITKFNIKKYNQINCMEFVLI